MRFFVAFASLLAVACVDGTTPDCEAGTQCYAMPTPDAATDSTVTDATADATDATDATTDAIGDGAATDSSSE